MTINKTPRSLEKLLLTYTSYSLNVTNMSFIFIWILVANACVFLNTNRISPSSESYSASLSCRTPTRNCRIMVDVYNNVVFGPFHRLGVLHIFHHNPICWPVLPLHTHFTNACGPLMSLKSVPFLVMNVCNCQRVWSNTLFNVIIHNNVLLYIETHLIQYILIYNIDINGIRHNRCILDLIFSHLVRQLASHTRL